MTTTWYYLEKGKEVGPFSGSDLKAKADMGGIFPHTSVYRLAGEDRSPWTRAGAIKALFPQDVTELLGPPICDKCGTVLGNNGCPKCKPPQIVEPKGDESLQFSLPTHKTISRAVKVETKYHYLRAYAHFMKFTAKVVLAVGILVVVFCIASLIAPDPGRAKDMYFISAIITAIVTVMQYILLMALSETFLVIMDTEENTRRTEINTRK